VLSQQLQNYISPKLTVPASQCSDLGITQCMQAVDSEDCSHYRQGTASKCCADESGYVTCSVVHSRTLTIIIGNCFVKCSFSVDHASSNDDSAVKLIEGK
jgi:hypothetical protein